MVLNTHQFKYLFFSIMHVINELYITISNEFLWLTIWYK